MMVTAGFLGFLLVGSSCCLAAASPSSRAPLHLDAETISIIQSYLAEEPDEATALFEFESYVDGGFKSPLTGSTIFFDVDGIDSNGLNGDNVFNERADVDRLGQGGTGS